MLRKRKDPKRKSIALSWMRDVQGSAAEKLRMFEKVRAADGFANEHRKRRKCCASLRRRRRGGSEIGWVEIDLSSEWCLVQGCSMKQHQKG